MTPMYTLLYYSSFHSLYQYPYLSLQKPLTLGSALKAYVMKAYVNAHQMASLKQKWGGVEKLVVFFGASSERDLALP